MKLQTAAPSAAAQKPFVEELNRKLLYAYYLMQMKLRKEPYRYIFILSHMRSGSSLLIHLLNANPDISAYGEAHLDYRQHQDLRRLICKIKHNLQELNLSEKYAADKILHNSHVFNEDLLRRDDISLIFLLRSPQESLSSMVKMWERQSHQEEQAQRYYADYYVQRLNAIEKWATALANPQKAAFITYDQLVNQTQSVFHLLQNFLELDTPFSEQYKLLPTTGVRGIGDPSEVIKSGQILRSRSIDQVEMRTDLLAPANEAFQQCLKTLQERCSIITT
jgi:hypothetical protein